MVYLYSTKRILLTATPVPVYIGPYILHVYVHLHISHVDHREYWSFNAIFRCVRKITAKSDHKLCHFCVSVRTEQHVSNCTEFVKFYVGHSTNIYLPVSKFANNQIKEHTMIIIHIGLHLAIHEKSTGNTVNDLSVIRFTTDALPVLGDKGKYTPHNRDISIS